MTYDHTESWQKLQELLAAKLPIAEAWKSIIDFHAAIKPKPYWETIRHLKVEDEQKDIIGWMEQILSDSPLHKSILALWIGLSRIWDEESEKEYYAIYLQGADKYDPEDIDWADEPRYDPENNYGLVGILTEVNDLIKEDEQADYEFLDAVLPLCYCALSFDEIIRNKQLDPSLFSRARQGLYITVGFEEGHHVDISRIVYTND